MPRGDDPHATLRFLRSRSTELKRRARDESDPEHRRKLKKLAREYDQIAKRLRAELD